jgi:hypothetical protein
LQLGWFAGIIMALGHFLGVFQHWLGRVLHTKFQLLRGSVCYANRILGQGNNSEGDTILTCIGVQYAKLCWRFERCLKTLQNSIACSQELHLSIRFDVSVLLWSASAWSWTDDWVIIHYFQPLCWVQENSTGLSFHQRFNIVSACFEVKITMLFMLCVGVTLGVDW